MAKVADIKTKPTPDSVEAFIESLSEEQKRNDSKTILQLMEKAMKQPPQMWGGTMIGFGNVRYKSPATGREVDWFRIGFAPRKANFSLHLVLDIKQYAETLNKLGKYKTGVGCLYINKLSDVNLNVLEEIINIAANRTENFVVNTP